MKTYTVSKILFTGFILLAACIAQAADEKDLIAILKSDASVSAKCTACQQLRIYGSAKSIPVLAALLTEENLSHAARYALEGMPYPEAGKALRSALDRTTGLNKAGVIDSLGWRRDIATVPLIVPLLSDTNVTLAATTASALGKISSDDAVAALIAARDNSNPEVQTAILDALLLCAEKYLSSGKKDEAVSLYRDLFQSKVPGSIRLAAWRGWMLSDSKQRRIHIPKALSGSDAHMRFAAIKIIRELKDRQLIDTCLQKWNSLPAPAQLAVLEVHLHFGSEALQTIRTASQSSHLEVRVAAWRALGDLSDASLIPAVVQAAAHGESIERDAAQEALIRMRGPKVRPALLNYLNKAKSSEKAELLRALGQRGDAAAIPILLENAKVDEDIVKLAALDSLRILASQDEIPALVDLIFVVEPTQAHQVSKTLSAVARRHSADKECTENILSKLDRARNNEQIVALLMTLGGLGNDLALPVLRRSLNDKSSDIQYAAIKALSAWPNSAAAEDLIKVARSSSNQTHRVLALRGYIDLVDASELSSRQKLEHYQIAMELADGNSEQKKVLSVLAKLSTLEAFRMAMSKLDEPSLKNEAAQAACVIAEKIYTTKSRQIKVDLEKIAEANVGESITKQAIEILQNINKVKYYIMDWEVSGPYMQEGKNYNALFDIPFEPEINDGKGAKWRKMPTGTDASQPFYLDILKALNGGEQRVAYLRTKLQWPAEGQVKLWIGSDDGNKVWVNGKLVHANNVARAFTPDQDSATVTLKKGENIIMMKITQNNMPWGASLSIEGSK